MDQAPQIDWDCIRQFIGYGNLDAPVVFLGMEEGAPEAPEALTADLLRRSTYPAVHEILPRPNLQRTWRVMCRLMLRREEVNALDNAALLAYQNEQLGRTQGKSLLAELFPYPVHSSRAWPTVYQAQFANRACYYEAMFGPRSRLLRELVFKEPRELVICYGKAHWQRYADVLEVAAPDPGAQGTWFAVRAANGTPVVFAPHFVSIAFNALAAEEEFCAWALRERVG